MLEPPLFGAHLPVEQAHRKRHLIGLVNQPGQIGAQVNLSMDASILGSLN